MDKQSKCPVTGAVGHRKMETTANEDWWPDRLNLKILEQHSQKVSPMGKDFCYKDEFAKLDYFALKEDLFKLMSDSQTWWPADYGHYGPLFIRMAWHSAGTYRMGDGRGGGGTGNQRFAPLNSWPDNVNLDKARRLLWPVKKKYGAKISWADLMILAGNCALESMGFKTIGFGGGREDIWTTEEDVYWGSEKKWLDDKRYSGERDLENPLAAVQMGLIYVNPEGPNGIPDAVASGIDVRETFARMAMNDEETVALIAGGHTFGKCHGASKPEHLGPEVEAAPVEQMGLGWKNSFGKGTGQDTISSGLEGAWNSTPVKWDNNYLNTLFKYDWNLVKSPAGAFQWHPSDPEAKTVPGAEYPDEKFMPMMTTADLSLRMDPIYKPIAKKFKENPDLLQDAFAKAWFKLTHRDMGPKSRYLGPEVPKEDFIWQDPIPEIDYDLVGPDDIAVLKTKLLESKLTISQLVKTAWASASTFRNSDKRGGANGARISLVPQNRWAVNNPNELDMILDVLKNIKTEFDNSHSTKISLADLIVLGGSAAIEQAIKNSGYDIDVPFDPGRNDATAEQTDAVSFGVLEPKVDGFRNYRKQRYDIKEEHLLVDKAQLLDLTAPEMTVLIGGLRVLRCNYDNSELGVLTDKTDTLSQDYFINLLDMKYMWQPADDQEWEYVAIDRAAKKVAYKVSRIDMVLGSNSQLRAICEVYASDDAKLKFIEDFIKAWTKIMNSDRFDLK